MAKHYKKKKIVISSPQVIAMSEAERRKAEIAERKAEGKEKYRSRMKRQTKSKDGSYCHDVLNENRGTAFSGIGAYSIDENGHKIFK